MNFLAVWVAAGLFALAGFQLLVLSEISRSVMSVQEIVDGLVVQVGKSKTELMNRLAELQLQVDSAGVAEQVDLSALSAAIQGLDDIVPDQVDEVPAE